VKYQYADESSRSCEVWLAKNYATEFHVLDELRGSPTRVAFRVDEQPALLPVP
jgi:hypothetical protein